MLLAALSLFLLFSPTAQILRHGVFDGYQRLFPYEPAKRPVTVVLIDENAIARYGQWPWPRTRMAELIRGIAQYEPASIGLDLVFPEPDRFSPGAMAAELPMLAPDVRSLLQALPSNDEAFANAVRGQPVVLGISAESLLDARFASPPKAAPIVVSGERLREGIRKFPAHIGNVPALDAAAHSRGLLNSGPQDQVVRVVPLLADVQGALVPSLGVESLRVALDAGIRLTVEPAGLLRMAFGGVDNVLQDDGHAWLRFSAHDRSTSIAATAAMTGQVNPEMIKDHVVLVGVSGLGLQDYKTTPLGEFIPGVYVHAQVAENLYNGAWLARPAMAAWVEAAALLLFGLLLILLVPRISALQGINVALAMIVALVGTGVIAFLHFHLLFDPVWPSIGIVAVFASVVVGTLSEAEKQRRQLRDQAAHMAGEVDAARRIQMGLLPDPSETLGHDRRFRLAAELEPARTVGGDFYDCFMLDARRLFLVVADVSGKGLPAALFMASAKSHIKSAALREPDVGEALTRAQDEIARENPEQLFVTAFAASLDVSTGMLEYANAGHEPPFVRAPHKAPERLEPPGGPPLCVVEDFVYPKQQRQLQPGEWVFVMTDGATEAMNRNREFFGIARVQAALSWAPDEAEPAQLVGAMKKEVMRFADGAEPADDLTLMALRWDGARVSGR